ncbi:hypothetical protein R0137_09860 [Congregibacter brevis]|uniref:Uncharacterized protein n=1 Tax=Congregibacter brevis TaxID=3081201 RepID=A0ABZ0IA06_9GAMM|nr:hypothetical protein R0137_09860 [Congregibacter sp. IMCC45268]
MLLRIFSEGLLIVVSILLALSADTWLNSLNQADQLDAQLTALNRDFDTMLVRVNDSNSAASRAVSAGRTLLSHMQEGSKIEPELARELLWHLVFYEVFTPSTGAYQSLIASGNLELLENTRLKAALTDFFGAFEDVRASEKLLLETQVVFFASESFSALAGWHRMGRAGVPVASDFAISQWSMSDEFMNSVAIYTVRQADVLEDYQYLKTRIESIAAMITPNSLN